MRKLCVTYTELSTFVVDCVWVLIDYISPWLFKIKKADMDVVSLGPATAMNLSKRCCSDMSQESKVSLINGATAIAILAGNATTINFVSGCL